MITALSKETSDFERAVIEFHQQHDCRFDNHDEAVTLATEKSGGAGETGTTSAIPAYASSCSSSRGFTSACFCLGFSRTPLAPQTTSPVRMSEVPGQEGNEPSSLQSHNFTGNEFGNITAPLFHNSTSETFNLTSLEPASRTNTWGFNDTIGQGITSAIDTGLVPSTTGPLPSNATAPLSWNGTAASNSTNWTDIGSCRAVTSVLTASPRPSQTRFPILNTTSASNPLNQTVPNQYTNGTVLARFVSVGSGLTGITTSAPFLKPTSTHRFRSTVSPSSPSPTIDRNCGESTAHFAVQVTQPGGKLDGWYLKLSGDAIIFTPSQELSTQFSVEDNGHLCPIGHVGTHGNAVIAIAENATEITGGAVYFIDPEVLEDIDELGYAALECELDGEALACVQGHKRYWVGCGLGLDITSVGDRETDIGGMDCTAITLTRFASR